MAGHMFVTVQRCPSNSYRPWRWTKDRTAHCRGSQGSAKILDLQVRETLCAISYQVTQSITLRGGGGGGGVRCLEVGSHFWTHTS